MAVTPAGDERAVEGGDAGILLDALQELACLSQLVVSDSTMLVIVVSVKSIELEQPAAASTRRPDSSPAPAARVRRARWRRGRARAAARMRTTRTVAGQWARASAAA